jgi:hypothetical protein
MFKLFRNKAKADAKAQWAQDAAYELLMPQLDLGSAFHDDAAKQRLLTPHGCGYVFGFADALLQRAGVTDELAAMAALVATYVRIFGNGQGPKIFRASLDLTGFRRSTHIWGVAPLICGKRRKGGIFIRRRQR